MKRYGPAVKQEVRFCTAPDGVRLAYAVHGAGPPLVRVATWLTHLDFDWESPVWRHWLAALGERHTVVRYDERGCGLSDSEPAIRRSRRGSPISRPSSTPSGWIASRCSAFRRAPAIAVGYAAEHPRAGHRPRPLRRLRARPAASRPGRAGGGGDRGDPGRLDDDDPTFRRVFSSLFLPHGTPEQMAWYEDLLRSSTTAETAVRLFEARGALDVSPPRAGGRARTLVIHARDDRVVPVEEGRLLAALIPDARLVLLESANHILLADEPAWHYFVSELHAFLGTGPAAGPPAPAVDLSTRELEVLELVAAGLTNEAIAERLFISVRTVERHLSNVYAKLGVSGKAARAAAAARFSRAVAAAVLAELA